MLLTVSGKLARRALVIHRDTPGIREQRLGRILSFFGVPWQSLSLTGLADYPPPVDGGEAYAVLGSVETLVAAFATARTERVVQAAAALYTYAVEDREGSLRALSALSGGAWTWTVPSGVPVPAEITAHCPELTGPMSGLRMNVRLAGDDGAVSPSDDATKCVPIVSVDGVAAFLHFDRHGVPAYFCASSAIVDIDAPVHANFYDVKNHFLAAVPLVMFVTSVFREVRWRAQELGACLIIDDPLLKARYGFCDFTRLRDAMRQRGFTTNIAFIPWNWRRTTRRASEFFRREADLFSVSIHGCDHVAAEFGSASPETLDHKARLAQTRMRAHQQRTGIEHEPVMVFPQGVFSRECPAALKLNEFVAAVNTEIAPVNNGDTFTAVRDVWDTAILAYGTFPIYTRRYASHGVDNFAFDLLLGKPCFIVAHHEFFQDRGTALISLVEKLSSLNCTLRWRSPREVIRRSYRRRRDAGIEHVEMYGSELWLTNDSDYESEIYVRKRESDPSLVASVEVDAASVESTSSGHATSFRYRLPPKSQALARVLYRGSPVYASRPATVKYQVTVAARRLLSEFRDEYVLPARSAIGPTRNSQPVN